ncbi:prolyl oligopeptidase family serine peptidase [soil metagenome]
MFLRFFLATVLLAIPVAAQEVDDPFIWLEDVEGEAALEWVEQRNAQSLAHLQSHHLYPSIFQDALEVLNSDDRIAMPSLRGDMVYNFWTDAARPRGIWRRTSLEDYLSGSPTWETVLDIDALGRQEGVNWVFRGSNCLPVGETRCLVSLSRGGADASEIREFDLTTLDFVENGFFLAEAKSTVAWLDRDAVLVGTDFGAGSLTSSGYARVIRHWSRGTDLNDAHTVLEADPTDVLVSVGTRFNDGRSYTTLSRRVDFFNGETYLYEGGELVRIEIPGDAQQRFIGENLAVLLRSEWEVAGQTYSQGSLITIPYRDFLRGGRDFSVVFAPDDRSALDGFNSTENLLLVNVLRDVRSELHAYRWDGRQWQGQRVQAPEGGTIGIGSTADDGDRFFFVYSSFLQPTTLYMVDDGQPRQVAALPAFYDTMGLIVEQFDALSADGTLIPYSVVRTGGDLPDGGYPTLLYGYGGFNVAMKPGYDAVMGRGWLTRGGAYVLANIRGGGEFGPGWHRAALREERQRAFDDFIAVAEDIIARGITTPEQLGINGGSNGGLLVGAVVTQRPDLFGAAISAVPLLDMYRYHRLLAGASWMAEYGNPDVPEDWEFIRQYSPYHNVSPDVSYPRMFVTTSTRDDRVHPGHARKMVALMESMGHDVLYYENIEGGHGGAATNEQRAMLRAINYVYLHSELKDDPNL